MRERRLLRPHLPLTCPVNPNPPPGRSLERDWPGNGETICRTPDFSWGQGLSQGRQEIAELGESFSQGFGEVLGVFPARLLHPTLARWAEPWQGHS